MAKESQVVSAEEVVYSLDLSEIPNESHSHWDTIIDLEDLRNKGSHEVHVGLLSTIMNLAAAEFRRCGVTTIEPEHIVHYALEIVRSREHFSLSCVREHVEHILEHIGFPIHDDIAITHLAMAYASAHPSVSSSS